jgi:hypothetical protein
MLVSQRRVGQHERRGAQVLDPMKSSKPLQQTLIEY